MTKTRLSANMGVSKYFLLLVAIMFGYGWLNSPPNDFEGILVLCLCEATLLVSAAAFHMEKRLDFDEAHLFISRRGKTEAVALSQVVSIKMTSFRVNYFHYWKVSYTDQETKTIKSVRFVPLRAKDFELFEKRVHARNHRVKLKNRVGPF